MKKLVVTVGHCDPDHASLQRLVSDFDCEIAQVHSLSEIQDLQNDRSIVLLLVNRVFDRCGSSGIELIKQIKSAEETREIPAMLISNFEDSQQESMAAGGIAGFGKAQLNLPETKNKLSQVLSG